MSLGIVKVTNILVVGVMVHGWGLAAAVDINGPIKRGGGDWVGGVATSSTGNG